MPFDSSPQKTLTRLDKLERLLWLAERATGNQKDICQCLHHDAAIDPILRASGYPLRYDWNDQEIWLGVSLEEGCAIFGGRSASEKAAYLRDLIARERAGKSKGEQR